MQEDAVRPSHPSSAREVVRGRMGGGGNDAAKLLTAEEVADRLDVGVKWVWAQARAGRIPHVRLGRYTATGGRAHRRVGPARSPGTTDGLTKRQAERKLRELMDGNAGRVTTNASRTIEHVGKLHSAKLAAKGRKRSHLETFESHLRVHLAPFFGQTPIDRIEPADVERLMARLHTKLELKPKTIRNVLGSLHSIFDYALRKGWVAENPCRMVEKPESDDSDPDIRFLTLDELEAVLRAIPDHHAKGKLTWEQVCAIRASSASNVKLAREFGVSDSLVSRIRRGLIWADAVSTGNIYAFVDRVLILTAAMTGGRQGELLALRWRDVDWLVQQARIRRAYVRGEMGKPKSKRSSRGVPLAMRVAGVLDELHRRSAYTRDDDLVFAHPHTGKPLDRSQVLKRFKRYCREAGLREQRFHDLRHTFGTQMAASGVPLRTIQEWMGHADAKTTQIYADYAPAANEAAIVEAAFAPPEGPLASMDQSMDQSERN
jgi:integrase